MSDFDTVLERLLLDPQFKSALASDAARTLAGYQLSDEERQILLTDMAGATGAQSLVEDRISKSSMFGLLSSLSGGLGNVTEYGPDTDGDAVALKEVDPMPLPHDADTPGTGLDGESPQTGPSPHMLDGPGNDGDAVAFKEVDPMPLPHDADTPGTGPDENSPQGGPSPHMLGDPMTPTPARN